jgi:quercetin dioxygenase-like cupin family protein
VRKGDSFCFKPASVHWIQNTGKTGARLIWVATPPSF